MSAVEALAEVLAEELDKAYGTSNYRWPQQNDVPPMVAALVAAIRSMPAEQVAELIGGRVELAGGEVVKVPGEWLPTIEWETCRVVTPWLPLGVSPETNGEQK